MNNFYEELSKDFEEDFGCAEKTNSIKSFARVVYKKLYSQVLLSVAMKNALEQALYYLESEGVSAGSSYTHGIITKAIKCYEDNDDKTGDASNCISLIQHTRKNESDSNEPESIDKETLQQIGRMCQIILGNPTRDMELDSLALSVGHHPSIIGK